MAYSLDVETFIDQIKNQPDIWDTSAQGYRHPNKKMEAWACIARVFINDFDDLNQVEKEDVYRKLHTKWRNLRDSYVRHRKNKYGKKGYMYAPYLTFLDILYDRVDDEQGSDSQDCNNSTEGKRFDFVMMKKDKKALKEEPEIEIETSWQNEEDERLAAVRSISQDNLKRSLNIEYVDTMMPDPTCSYSADNEDRAFFDSLLPAVRDMDIDQKLEFRSGVLKLIKTIRCSKKRFKSDPDDDFEYPLQ